MKKKILLSFNILFLFLGCFTKSHPAHDLLDTKRVQLNSKHAILVDLFSGKTLFEKDADAVVPPASMTKLVTIWVALNAVQEGKCQLEDKIRISQRADYHSQPADSSLMFLEQGQRVTLLELLVGLAIPSGNDAAIAVAETVSGSVSGFVNQMNDLVKNLGLTQTVFVEPSGYSNRNRTTAREFAIIATKLWGQFPTEIEKICGRSFLAYPMARHYAQGGSASIGTITQTNHNELMGRLYGVVGLKTGFIDASGFNVALAARRGQTQLVAVLMGGAGESVAEGQLRRAVDGVQLLTWGFENFITLRLRPPLSLLKIGKYKVDAERAETITVRRGELERIKIRCRINWFRLLFLKAGRPIGTWDAKLGKNIISGGSLFKGSKIE